MVIIFRVQEHCEDLRKRFLTKSQIRQKMEKNGKKQEKKTLERHTGTTHVCF